MPELAQLLRRHATRVDVAAVVLLGGPLVLLGVLALSGLGQRQGPLALVLGVGMVAPLAWRRARPLAVLVLVCATGGVQLVLLPTPLPADAAFALALYTVTARAGNRALRWTVLAIGLIAALLCAVAWQNPGYLPFLVLTVVIAVISGRLRYVRAAYVAGLVQRAESAELEREQQLRLAESAERARIAREMHDVVAHSLSVIIAQADGGAYIARADPDRAVQVLTTIGGTGREALRQMRDLLGVLRENPTVATKPPTEPQPGLHDLPRLIGATADAGLPVHAQVPGPPGIADVPQATGLVAYRVVQESLTNVFKHAGRVDRVEVAVERIGDRLRIEISDDGRGPAPGSGPVQSGHGLAGMRERVALLGGRLVAGPRPGGGFRTVATLPVPHPAVPPQPADPASEPSESDAHTWLLPVGSVAQPGSAWRDWDTQGRRGTGGAL